MPTHITAALPTSRPSDPQRRVRKTLVVVIRRSTVALTRVDPGRNHQSPAPGNLASPEHDVILSGTQVRVAHGFAADVGTPYRRA